MKSRYRKIVLRLILCVTAVCSAWSAIMAADKAGAGDQSRNRSKFSDRADSKESQAEPDSAGISGREIFLREWIPNDPRSHGGDGLGPVFNDTSCVSCHNQGGVGGSGSEAKNVVVITAFLAGGRVANAPPRQREETTRQEKSASERQELLDELRNLHPGLAVARSVVLHRSGTDPKNTAWRDDVLAFGTMFNAMAADEPQATDESASDGGFFGALLKQAERQKARELQPPRELQAEKLRSLAAILGPFAAQAIQANNRNGKKLVALPSQRNATALFGAGLIDSIPDEVLTAAAARKHPDFPEISGRVARLKDGKIGRFGWKSQKARLHDFTMTACAVELGLNVPDQPQAGAPLSPDYQPAGFDLNQEECLALVAFVKDLPAPVRTGGDVGLVAEAVNQGEQLFARVGCAACHQPALGEVRGIYSDLLLHDMGPEMGDARSEE